MVGLVVVGWYDCLVLCGWVVWEVCCDLDWLWFVFVGDYGGLGDWVWMVIVLGFCDFFGDVLWYVVNCYSFGIGG